MSVKNKRQVGFTVVELLIVIVVIAILAVISVVVYQGLQDRARVSTLTADLSQASKQLELTKASDGVYPSDDSTLKRSSGTVFQYSTDITADHYCLTGTNGSISYRVSSAESRPVDGGCDGHSQGSVATVVNLSRNPRALAAGGAWTNNNPSRFSVSRVTTIPSHPSGITTAMRSERRPDGSPAAEVLDLYNIDGVGGSSGISRMTGVWVYVSGEGYRARIYRSKSVDTLWVTVPAQTWTFVVSKTPTSGLAYIKVSKIDGSTPDDSDYAYATGSISIAGNQAPSGYYDGDSPSWAWGGTPYLSSSSGLVLIPALD